MVAAAARGLLTAALGFYFRRLELLGADRIPASGPLLIVANHPNSLADAAVAALLLPRRFSIVATAALFRFPPVAWLLRRLGVIPVNRASDDPRAMRSVAATFEAVFAALAPGGAVLIFPEGITYDEPALRPFKSGPARMALELEHRHGGALGLKVLPVGLHYPRKGRYRGDALAYAGEALAAADFLAGYPERKKEAVERLTAAIEESIKGLVVHVPDAARARTVDALVRLRGAGAGAAEDLGARRAAAAAVEKAYAERPAEAAAFAGELAAYERLLARLAVDDAAVRAAAGERLGTRASVLRGVAVVVLAPVAFWGAIHRALPLAFVAWAVPRLDRKDALKARVGTHALLVAIPAFAAFYGALVALVHARWGWPASLWYGLSLAPAGLLAEAYQGEAARLWEGALRLGRVRRLARGPAELARRRAGLLAKAAALSLPPSTT
jgi:1-acyl-sn-glycerol-3-phosphate acyltransferase